MPRDADQSLGEQPTYQGGRGDDPPSQGDAPSLGDEMTLGGTSPSSGDTFDDGMEVVDLSSRYTVEGTLGKGGMGEVLLATDTRLNRKVAIKRVLGDAAKSQTAVKRFLTEAQSIAALNHFNIVQIYDYGRDSDGPFLIMEHVDGGSLLDKCREGALPLEEAVELTCQLCDGLSVAHAAGIIHRDIKPANVLMTSRGEPKLTDFGLARQDTADTGQTMAGAVLGTLDFMPPEQRRDATQTDNRSDLWSLAATLYQLVTGKSPKIIRFNDVPESLQDALGKALEEAPGDRYQSAGEFRQALQAAVQQAPSGPARDLTTGECRSCGHANDPGRKFCQSCGGPLTEACLSCQQGNGVWETFCASCGANQEQLAESKITELSEQRSRVDSLCREYRYDDALQIVAGLADQTHPRFAEFPAWAKETRPEIEREYAEAKAERERLIGEARSLMGQQEYGAVPRLFESLAKGLWNSDVQGLVMQAEQSEKEAAELLTDIKQLVRDRSYEGLLEKTERFLELRPDRKDIREIHATLSKRAGKRAEKQAVRDKVRSAEILDEVREKMRAKDFASVVMLLADLPEGYETEESMDLLRKAQVRVEQSEKLLKQIDKAVKKGQTSRLLPKLDDYLKLVSTDERIESLREKLAAQQRVLQRKVKAGLAGVCLLVVTVTVGMYLKSRADEKAQAIAAAVESKSWDTVLTLDAGNTTALLGRVRNRLNADPPEFHGAMVDLQAIEAEDPEAEGLSGLKATLYARRAGVQADSDDIKKAEVDLKEAESLDVAPAELAAVREKLAAAHLRYAGKLADAGQLDPAMWARDQAVTYGADAGALASFNDRLAEGHLKQAESLTLISSFDRALEAIAAARLLNAAMSRIEPVEAAVYVQRARQSLNDGDRDAASADFLQARKLNGKAQGLGELAAGLADGLVKRCEDDFTDAAFEEATAALATVTELEPDSESLPGLKDRLGKVLVSQGDAALADGSLPRVGAIIESLRTLGVLPDDQVRLSNALALQYADETQQHVASADVAAAASSFQRLQSLSLADDAKKPLAALLEDIQTLVIDQLKSKEPEASLAALKTLSASHVEFSDDLRKTVASLPRQLRQRVPESLSLQLDPSICLAFTFDTTESTDTGTDGFFDAASSRIIPFANAETGEFANAKIGEGVRGNALILNKTAFEIPRETLPLGNAARTVACWVKLDATKITGSAMVFNYGTMESDDAVYIMANLRGGTKPCVGNPGGRNEPLINANIMDNQWHHIALVNDGNGTVVAFIDKEERLRFKKTYRTSWGQKYDRKFQPNSNIGGNCVGAMDDFVILSRALTASEIHALADDGFESLRITPPIELVTTDGTLPLAVAPFNATQAKAHQKAWGDYLGVPVEYSDDIGMQFVLIPPGEFLMGARDSDPLSPAESIAFKPQHPVRISRPFYIGIRVVSQAQYTRVRSTNPSKIKGATHHVTNVSWDDATAFISQLPSISEFRGRYRLPTEAEWEYSNRAGTQSRYFFGDSPSDVSPFCRRLGIRSENGELQNPWGIFYETEGLGTAEIPGIWEWPLDGSRVYSSDTEALIDPKGPLDRSVKGLRRLQSYFRGANLPQHGGRIGAASDLGFRVVLEIPESILKAAQQRGPNSTVPPTLNEGLVAHYPFNGNAKDESENGNDGAVQGARSVVGRHGQPDGAYSFDGKKSVVFAPDKPYLNLVSPATFTLSFWAKRTGPCDFSFIVAKDRGNRPNSSTKWTVTLGKYERPQHTLAFHWHPGGRKAEWVHSKPIEWDLSWHSYAISRSGPHFVFYRDGVEIGVAENAVPLPADNPGEFTIGSSKYEGEPSFVGEVDDVRVYNLALSPEEVKALFDYESQPHAKTAQAPPPAVAPFNTAQAKAHQKAWADHVGLPVETTNSIGMKFVVIPPGEFMMGSPEDEAGRDASNEPLHKVTLTQPVQMGMHEVGQEQYEKVMGSNPSKFKGPQNPIEMVSWNDAVEFCRKLSAQPEEKTAGYVFRLPTEAEWEYACRAGTKTRYSFGDDESALPEYGWFDKNSRKTTHPVGEKQPNAWGLYDMHGNVWEWCSDWYVTEYSRNTPLNDPRGPNGGTERVYRGGSYHPGDYAFLPSASRRGVGPTYKGPNGGFRVVVELPESVLTAAQQRGPTSSVPTTLNEGLVAHYPFNGNAKDESENGNHCVVKGATLSVDRNGISEEAYTFDGVDDYLSAPHREYLNGTAGAFSISLWVAIDRPSYSNTLLSKNMGSGTKPKWIFAVRPPVPGKIRGDPSIVMHVNPGDHWLAVSPWKQRPGAWQHCVIVQNGTDYSTYINGVLAGKSRGVAMLPNDNLAALTIGQYAGNSWLKESLDDIRIYDRALPPDEVKTVYKYESQPVGSKN